MRKCARLAGLFFTLGLVGVLAPAAAPAKKTAACNAPKFKVGKFCVKATTSNSKGSLKILLVRFQGSSHPTKGVQVQVIGTFTTTCSDGSSQTVNFLGGRGQGLGTLRGSSFTLDANSNHLRIHASGRWTSNTKAVISSYTRTTISNPFPPAKPVSCTFTASNVAV